MCTIVDMLRDAWAESPLRCSPMLKVTRAEVGCVNSGVTRIWEGPGCNQPLECTCAESVRLHDCCSIICAPDVTLLTARPSSAQLVFSLLKAVSRGPRGLFAVYQQHGERASVCQPRMRSEGIVQDIDVGVQERRDDYRHLRHQS